MALLISVNAHIFKLLYIFYIVTSTKKLVSQVNVGKHEDVL